jgi:bacillithiol biosynthesis cysteine-adding enzyme BshC
VTSPPAAPAAPASSPGSSPAPTDSFSAAWLAGEGRALALLPDAYRHPAARAAAAAAAAARPLRPEVHAALVACDRDLHAGLAPAPARARNLARLAEPGSVAVVTGQQVGLFLGPLYTVYKAASAVADARALEAETGRPCVPVFWLQTEDHDLPEVDHCLVARASGGGAPLRLSLGLEAAAASRVPVAGVRLGEGVGAALAALEAEVGELPHAPEHLALLRDAYRAGATLPQAFVRVLSSLFAEEGLVVVDPRHPALLPLAAPVHARALAEADRLSAALAARSAALAAAGFAEQVRPREGSPLFFVSPEGEGGPRYRLEPQGEGRWALAGHPEGARVTSAQLEAWLAREPGRFTTSALLRPLLQDSLLPTAAYVGGPGEVAYFAQVPPLHAAFGLPLPLVVPRGRFRVLEARTRALLEALRLTPAEACAPREALLARLAARDARAEDEPPAALEARLAAPLLAELARLEERFAQLEAGLPRALARTRGTVERAVSRLAGRYGRALATRDRVVVERVDRLQAALQPEGAPQERVHALATYACRHGGRAFVAQVLAACEPFSGALKELSP